MHLNKLHMLKEIVFKLLSVKVLLGLCSWGNEMKSFNTEFGSDLKCSILDLKWFLE